jgi:hypothetical protein
MPDPQPPISDADRQAAQTVQSQIQRDQEAEQAHRLEVQLELQTRIFEIQMDITSRPSHVHEGITDHGHDLHPMDGYIRGFAEPDHDHPTVTAHHDQPVGEGHDVIAHVDPAAGTEPGHDAA